MHELIERAGSLLRGAGPGVVLLGIVIFVHELGHFLAAKARGVKVLRFSLGFGPRLIGVTYHETEYRLSWVPLGGYVQMAGDSPAENGEMPSGREQFLSHPWPGRVLIAVAGPLANLITAFLILVAVGLIGVSYPDSPNVLGVTADSTAAYKLGLREGDKVVAADGKPIATFDQILAAHLEAPRPKSIRLDVDRAGHGFTLVVKPEQREPLFSSLTRVENPPIVGGVLTGMPAYKSGLKEGDRILSVDGTPVSTWSEMRAHIGGHADKPIRLQIRRGTQTFDIMVTPVNSTGQAGGIGQIGIEPVSHLVYVEKHSLPEAIDLGFRATLAQIGSVYRGMWLTVSRPLYYREYLGGPLFIAQAASESARRGLDSYLMFLAMINLAIMAFNLMPLPVLDGGHIVLALFEGVRRQAISARTYLNFQKAGLVLIGTLFVLILANDPWRLIQRQRALDRAPRAAPEERAVAPAPP